jgi:hypothetical protein
MHKNYTGDFNGSFGHRQVPNYPDQTIKSFTTNQNNINQSEAMTSHSNGFSKAQYKKMKTANSYDEEIEYNNNN